MENLIINLTGERCAFLVYIPSILNTIIQSSFLAQETFRHDCSYYFNTELVSQLKRSSSKCALRLVGKNECCRGGQFVVPDLLILAAILFFLKQARIFLLYFLIYHQYLSFLVVFFVLSFQIYPMYIYFQSFCFNFVTSFLSLSSLQELSKW